MNKKIQGTGIAIIVLALARCFWRIVRIVWSRGLVFEVDQKVLKRLLEKGYSADEIKNALKATAITLDIIFAIFVVLVGVFAIRAAKNITKTRAFKVFAAITALGTILIGWRSYKEGSWISVCFALIQLALIGYAWYSIIKTQEEDAPQVEQEDSEKKESIN